MCTVCGTTRNEGHIWSKDCEKCDRCGQARSNAHNWHGCQCFVCGKTRNENHAWSKDCEKCSICGQVRLGAHKWNGCQCSICNILREEGHDWKNDCEECSRCGKARSEVHKWQGCKCTTCGKARDEGHDWMKHRCTICGAMCDHLIQLYISNHIFGNRKRLSDVVFPFLQRSSKCGIKSIKRMESENALYSIVTICTAEPEKTFEACLYVINNGLINEIKSWRGTSCENDLPFDYNLMKDVKALYYWDCEPYPLIDEKFKIIGSANWLWPKGNAKLNIPSKNASVLTGHVIDWFFLSMHVPYEGLVRNYDHFFKTICDDLNIFPTDLPGLAHVCDNISKKIKHGQKNLLLLSNDVFGVKRVQSADYKVFVFRCHDPFRAPSALVVLVSQKESHLIGIKGEALT